VTLAEALGSTDLYCASQGNAAISLAAFCAHRGLGCHVFVSASMPPSRLAWLNRFGADLRVIPGAYDEAYLAAEAEGRAHGWYSRNCALNPFLVEGKKTAAFEIAEQLGGRAPDWVAAPVGDGCTLAALGKGFRELKEMGEIDRLPRLLGVQAEAASPLVDRFRGAPAAARETCTRATSIAVRQPRNALRLLSEVRASDGTLLAVADAEIARAQRRLFREGGVAVEFSSAAALAGLLSLAAAEPLAGAVAVLVLTGGRLDDGEA
jgi:threonine synthase